MVTNEDGSDKRPLATLEHVLSFDTLKRLPKAIEQTESQKPAGNQALLASMPWDVMDTLLLDRNREKMSFSTMQQQGEKMNLDARKLERFIDSYKQLVEMTGFDDFEFDGSELVDSVPTRATGVEEPGGNDKRACACCKASPMQTKGYLKTQIDLDNLVKAD